MAIAYSYVRFSSKRQEEGDSVRRQDKWATDFCRQHSHTLDKSLNLYDLGRSAFKNAHAETGRLAAFLEAIKSGRVKKGQILCVESLDRLSRAEVRKALSIFLQIIDAGIVIATKEGIFDDESVNDTANLVIAIITMCRSYDEGARKSDRQLNAWGQKRLKAAEGEIMTRQCPKWLKVSEDGTKFIPIPERVEVIKKIFAWRLEGIGESLIVKRLHELGIRPFAGKQDLWQRCSVINLAKDRRLLGEYQPCQGAGYGSRVPNGPAIPNYYPVIIDETTFKRVQAMRRRGASTAPRNASRNLFSGLLHDARDKTKIVLAYTGNAPTCLISMGARDGKKGSVRHTFSYDAFEFGLISWLRELRLDENDTLAVEYEAVKEQLAETNDKIGTVQAKLLEVKDCAPLVDVLNRLDAQQKERQSHVDSLADQLAATDRGALRTAQAILKSLDDNPSDHELRHRVRVQVRNLVKEIWVLMTRTGRRRGNAEVQVHFRSGEVRRVRIVTGPKSSWKPGEAIVKENIMFAISADGLDEVADLRKWSPTTKTPARWPKYTSGDRWARKPVAK